MKSENLMLKFDSKILILSPLSADDTSMKFDGKKSLVANFDLPTPTLSSTVDILNNLAYFLWVYEMF